MRKLKLLFSILIAALLFVSCVPEADENGNLLHGIGSGGNSGGGGNGGGGTSVVKLLSKITNTDDNGNPYTINYKYTTGKLTTITTSNNTYTYNFTYNGDNVAKVVKTETDNGDLVTTTFTPVFSTSNVLTKLDAVMESGGTNVRNSTTNFVYNTSGKVTDINTVEFFIDPIDNSPEVLYNITSKFQYNGSNISSWDFTIAYPSSSPIVIPPINIKSAFSNYDSRKNPYNTLPLFYNLLAIHEDIEASSFIGLSVNNPKTITAVTNAGVQSGNATYTYDSDGYATSVTSDGETIKYEYVKP